MLRALAAPISPPRRWTSDPLPRYRHVPGLTPHPLKDPQGHSYTGTIWQEPSGEVPLADGWQDVHSYLLGVDLFNQAYLWEAHEAWEEVWNTVGRSSLPGRMVQGLIQVAAALLKRHMGSLRGAAANYGKASAHFDAIERELARQGVVQAVYMGVDLLAWRSAVEEYLADERASYPFLVLDREAP